MQFPNQNYENRDCQLPAGCKDLTDSINHEKASAVPPMPDPPITRQISLPQKVSVRYLAEVSGASLGPIEMLMRELRICVSVMRSIDFEDAAKILRKYGIEAKRESI
jgi:hypothetical protein